MKWGGLTDDEAFALVTINPAKQLKIDNRVGSLEQGKDADVVIWSHHPLSSYAIAERTYIDGIAYYDRIAEERRLTDMRKEKEGLLTAEKQDRRAPRRTRRRNRPSLATQRSRGLRREPNGGRETEPGTATAPRRRWARRARRAPSSPRRAPSGRSRTLAFTR